MPVDRRSLLKLGLAAAALEAGPAAARAVAPGRYGAAVRAIHDYARLHLSSFGLPGMTVALADGEGWSTTLQVGFADVDRRIALGPDHLFEIGSISKSFAAISILRLIEAGRFGLDTAAAELLPEVPWPAGAGITVRHLLTHTTGLPDDAPIFPRGGDQRLWQGFAAGAQFSYSNLGYELLGLIVEKIGGRPYGADVADTFARVGMSRACPTIRSTDRPRYAVGYEPLQKDRPVPWPATDLCPAPFNDFPMASGSIAATPADMAAYVRWLIGTGVGRGAGVLSDASAKQFTTPVIKAPDFGPLAQYAMGLAVVPVAGRPCLHHTGGMVAFSSSIHVDAPAGVGAFASVNANINGYRPRLLTNFACQALRAVREGTPIPPAPVLDLNDHIDKAASLAGRFTGASGEGFEIRVKGPGLVLIHAGRETPLEQKGANLFAARDPRFALYLLAVEREGERAMAVWHGNDFFSADPSRRAPPVPDRLRPCLGRYDNDSPWEGVFRITARGDSLWLDGVEPLVAIGDGLWRVGEDPHGCERVRFDGVVGGRALRMNFSGRDYNRVPDGANP